MDTSYTFLLGIISLLSNLLGNQTPDLSASPIVTASTTQIKEVRKAATPTVATSSRWSTYLNEKYDISFNYPKDLKTLEEVYEDDGRSVSDPSHAPRPYLWFETEIPFVTKYDTWTSKIIYMTAEENSAEQSCSKGSKLWNEGQKTTINGREYSYLTSYHTYDSYLEGQQDTSEKESVENVARVEYGTRTDSHCYVIGLYLSGSGPYSDELRELENPSYPPDSKAFFDSEQVIFNRMLDTITFSE